MSAADQQLQRELAEDFNEFLRNYYHDDLGELAQLYPNDRESLRVSWRDLHRFDPEIVDLLAEDADLVRDALATAVAQYDLPVDVDLSGAAVRIYDVPDANTLLVGEFSPSDRRGTWAAIEGQVSKRTEVKPDPDVAVFVCQRCGYGNEIAQPDGDLQEPYECESCERQGPFSVDFDQSSFTDMQWIKLEQPPDVAQGNSQASLEVVLRNDLVDSVESGDRVTVTGDLTMVNDDGDFSVYVEADALSVDDTDFHDIDVDAETRAQLEAIDDPIETLRDSLAVRIQGYEHIKESIVLQLVAGTHVEFSDGSMRRGNIHILNLGDPGTAKSRLLGAAEQVAPRSVYTSGKGATEAGMTASAVQDDFGDAEWTLEPGALVVANDGLACVDEIDKIPSDVVSSMHDALSTAQVHVNKAGINTTLQAQTAVLAAGNPKHGRFDDYEALNEQVDLGPTILSRFDLIFQLRDKPDEERDTEIADHITRLQHLAKQQMKRDAPLDEDEAADVEPEIDHETFRQYVAHARSIVPTFASDDVRETLRDEHVRLRSVNGTDQDATVPVTHRKLEGAYRLAEASAKARLSESIEHQDVERALRLIGRSLQDWGQNEDGEFDADVTEASSSTTQRERIKAVDQIVRDIQAEYDEGAPVDVVVDRAEEQGLAPDRVEHAIEKLKREGELVEPRTDHLRSV